MGLRDLLRRRRIATDPPRPPLDPTVPLPPQGDWGWRPPIFTLDGRLEMDAAADGTELADGTKLFHDCPLAEIAVTQVLQEVPPLGLRLTVGGFEGGFLSLALDLPRAGWAGLSPSHIVEVILRAGGIETIYARLNLRHGPNIETLTETLRPGEGGGAKAEFDLGMEVFSSAKLTHAWLDFIFEDPAGREIVIEELTVTRRPRADL
ncbi:DUF6478 family protein [Jannaschia aquimarina]|uniref:Uncharacterized protein n=1 Tax=Jannaschia aquimarina TaxID=935700 RepID=A0A0D1EFG1_9RHOB|nr:DUF6478 family protein [Jannaschia aquimarina]KIT16359.1 hypothetical protein jaqu_19550 [Jannaschia aquimarina]SNT25631.1 hypothetical protein SAMN05421775_10930 [Jannaschia aquimarina]